MIHKCLIFYFPPVSMLSCSISRFLSVLTCSEVQLIGVCHRERKRETCGEKVIPVNCSLLLYPLIHSESCPPGSDRTGFPEVSDIPSQCSSFSVALFFLLSALQQTLSRPLRSPFLLPLLFLSVSSSFLPHIALIFFPVMLASSHFPDSR